MSKLRESARGEQCTIRLPGCLPGTETVVLAHANGSAAGKGIGMKSPDILGAFACYACHQAVDGQRHIDHYTRDDIRLSFWEAHARTVRRWLEMGLIAMKRGVTEVEA